MNGATARRSARPIPATTVAFAVATALTLVAQQALPQAALEEPWLWVTALVLLGLPHGAVDPLLTPVSSTPSRLTFYGIYLGLLAGMAVFWWSLPGIALTAFLLMSVWHFAHDWPRRAQTGTDSPPSLLGYAGASCIVVLPCVFHPQWVVAVFTLLARSPLAAEGLQQVMATSLPLLVLALLWGARSALRDRAWMDLAEVSLLVLALTALPPLVSFTLYFCCVHSPRHLAEVARCIPDPFPVGLTAALFTALTVFAAAALVWLSREMELRPALTSVVFIGLSVLTVPHLWAVSRWQRARETADRPQSGEAPEVAAPPGNL